MTGVDVSTVVGEDLGEGQHQATGLSHHHHHHYHHHITIIIIIVYRIIIAPSVSRAGF